MITKLDHIGIAVKNLDEAMNLYQKKFNLKIKDIEEIKDQRVKVAVIPIGDTNIELLQSTDPEGAIAKFITNKGEGVHHIALRVEAIEDSLQMIKAVGIQLIDEKPRIGAHNSKIAFIHPKSTKGVLLELCERKE